MSLLKKRLAACVNIIPGVDSKFWWKLRIESAQEVMMVVKTKISNFKKIEKEVRRLHNYEVPEIIAIPIITGSSEYLKWIDENVGL